MTYPNRVDVDPPVVSRRTNSSVAGRRQGMLVAGQGDVARGRFSGSPEPDVGRYPGFVRIGIAVGLSVLLWLAVAGVAALLARLFWR